ncbi:uncharacterized protein LOC124937402 [Impatiens glandulifera]|uniref:uncharacterized protein LOC124937402 n=1 Tax=Impatiens glandulifera TaxID=253017 RepID=UPI001FB0A2EE|nr:uncharacterized protein LOC124937402 [Impatiens glandulifera]
MRKASKVQSSSSFAAPDQDENTLLTGLIEALKDQNRLQGEHMRAILQANGNNHNNQEGGQAPIYKLYIEQFMSFKPADFKGSTDPIISKEWMQSMETIFEFMQITEAERVRCATFMLKDDARIWWQGAKVALDLNTITWREFKEVFYGKYFTLSTRNKLTREFLEIKQGDASIADYVKRFERGKYFAKIITGDATMELNHFLEGLNPTIRRDVRLSNPSSMREMVDRALMAEKDSQDILREAQAKRASYQGRDFHGPAMKKPFNQSYTRTALPHSSYNQTANSQHSQQQPKIFSTATTATTTEVNMVKVLWHNSSVEEATMEVEQDMQKNYPELFYTQP